jgi:NADPH:quinone reductase-like Zn-dependent oxidoreductase
VKAFAISGPDKPASLVSLPEPEVGARDVQVGIRAASVNGFDVYQASGYLLGMMEHRFPTIVGRDLAGVVEAIGSEVTGFAVGDEVLGFVPSTPPLQRGSFAERISGADLVLVAKPTGLDFHQAAALPLTGTAALDLLSAVNVKEGDTLLIVGATGGVGSFAVQLAAIGGATVIATARPEEEAFVRQLGALQTIDYSAGSIADAVRRLYPDGITALIDVVHEKDALTDLGSVVGSGGRVASLRAAADLEHFGALGVAATNVIADPTPDKLRRLAGLVSSGELLVPIQRVYSIDQIEGAFEAFRQGKRGKLIVSLGSDRDKERTR